MIYLETAYAGHALHTFKCKRSKLQRLPKLGRDELKTEIRDDRNTGWIK